MVGSAGKALPGDVIQIKGEAELTICGHAGAGLYGWDYIGMIGGSRPGHNLLT